MKTQTIQEIIASAKSVGERVNVCGELFLSLEKEKKQGNTLKQIARIAEDTWFAENQRTEPTPSSLSEMITSMLKHRVEEESVDEKTAENNAEMMFLISRHKKLAQALIDLYCDKGDGETEYYGRIWNGMSLMLSASSANEKGACLYAFLLDRRTPYFEVKPGMQMRDVEYKEALKHLSGEIDIARFILSLNNKQKTETASQLLELIDKMETPKEKVVLFSRIMTMIKKEKRDDDDEE